MTELTQPLATILAALIAAFLGSWFGTAQALSRVRRERAFDRQLDWYERFIRSLYELAQKIEVALTFQRDTTSSPEHLANLWRQVQSAHLTLDRLAMEAPLYGNPTATRSAQSLQSAAQAVANKSEGFAPLTMSEIDRHAALQDVEALSQLLYDGSRPLIDAARAHLGIK